MSLELGHYVIVNEKPPVVGALSAVPKPDSEDVHLIHDCSMPKGKGFNSYSKVNSFKFQTLDDAIKLLKPGYFMSNIDLKSAYRSVPIHPSNYAGTGLSGDLKLSLLILWILGYHLVVNVHLKFLTGLPKLLGGSWPRKALRLLLYTLIIFGHW